MVDTVFFTIEALAGFVLLPCLISLLGSRREPRGLQLRAARWPAALLVVAAFVLGPGIAVLWLIVFQAPGFLEGVLGLFFGLPAAIVNALLAGFSAFVLLERRVRWLALLPAGLAVAFLALIVLDSVLSN